MLRRLTLLSLSAALCAFVPSCVAVDAPQGSVAEKPAQVRQDFLYGADVSGVPVMEKRTRLSFSDEAGKADAVTVLRRAGVNCFRLRLFVRPVPGGEEFVTNDLPYTLELARRVKASGASLLLDIHYSDTWADPAKQYKPAAWKDFPFEKLVAAVREYSFVVISCFAKEGVMPEYVQVGNEITNGMLWPDGKAEYGQPGDQEGWDRFAQLLKAGITGVEQGSPKGAVPKIVLHIESTGNVPRTQWFFDNAAKRGVRWDIAGLSYYPEWHGEISDLSATMEMLATRFNKPVVVAEVAYPWKQDEHWIGRPHMSFPLTPQGQKDFLLKVREAVAKVPGNLGAGIFYWHPEGVSAWGVHAWVGGSCSLFDDKGRLLPGAALFAPAKP